MKELSAMVKGGVFFSVTAVSGVFNAYYYDDAILFVDEHIDFFVVCVKSKAVKRLFFIK